MAEHLGLLIMGKMGAGKSYASAYLSNRYGAASWTVAQRIRELTHALLDQNGQLDSLLQAVIPDPSLRADAVVQLLSFADAAQTDVPQRQLYQQVGQLLRDLSPQTTTCWEEELQRRIETSPSPFQVVACRSHAGYNFFATERGYYSLRIDAPEEERLYRLGNDVANNTQVLTHPSETDVDTLQFDFTIINDGDLERFYTELDAVCEQLGIFVV